MRESIVFENNLDTQVGRWVEFAVPKQDRNRDIAEIGGSKAIKLRDVGEHSTLYGALLNLKPGRSEWKFDTETTLQSNIKSFVLHPAIADDIQEIIPQVEAHAGGNKIILPMTSMKPIEKNEARVVYELTFTNGALHTTLIYTIWSVESSVRFQAETVWCDHDETTDFEVICDKVVYSFNKAAKNKLDIFSDFALTDDIHISNNTNEIIWEPPTGRLGYAEVYRFDGYLFNSLNEDDPMLNDPANEIAEESIRVDGPMVGVYTNWANQFLAYRATPQRFFNSDSEAASQIYKFRQNLATKKDMYQKRPHSCDLRPGIAGGQPAFGSTKGGPVVTALQPRMIRAYCWSMADEALRPVHRREPDGSIVLMRNHPEHRTWMRTTHQNSKDFLGKGKMQPRSNQGASKRYGHDESHVADYMSAYFALTGDYMAERWYISMLQGELATINSYVGWLSTDRGQGRVAQFYANAYLLLPEFRTEIEAVMLARTKIVEEQWPAKNVLTKDRTLPVMVVDIGKDVRWMADPDGNAVEAFSCWQTAKCAAGLWAFAQVCEDPHLADRNRNIALLCARTVVACFFKNAQGDWAAPYAVRYYVDDREGQLPEMVSNNWEVNGDGSGWTVDWSFAAVSLYAIHGGSEIYRRKAIQLMTEIPEPTRWDYSEWRAV